MLGRNKSLGAIFVEYARIAYDGAPRWCVLDNSRMRLIEDGDPLNGWSGLSGTVDLTADTIQFLPPCTPSQIIIVGWNYVEHTRETGSSIPEQPMCFPLSPAGLSAHRRDVIVPGLINHVEHEAELVVIIGKTAKNVKAADALSYVLGVTCGNDVSARDIQNHPKFPNLPRAKTVDTFKPVGPYLVTGLDFSDLVIQMKVNDEIRQDARTSDMIFKVPELIEFITRTITLYPWDIIFTGTPKGCTKVKAGDRMLVTIENVGTLSNTIVSAS